VTFEEIAVDYSHMKFEGWLDFGVGICLIFCGFTAIVKFYFQNWSKNLNKRSRNPINY